MISESTQETEDCFAYYVPDKKSSATIYRFKSLHAVIALFFKVVISARAPKCPQLPTTSQLFSGQKRCVTQESEQTDVHFFYRMI